MRCEAKATKVASRKNVGQCASILNVEEFKRPAPCSSFLHFVQEQSSIGRNANWPDRHILSPLSVSGIDEQAVLAVPALTHKDAWLFLPTLALAKEVASPSLLQGVVGLYVQ